MTAMRREQLGIREIGETVTVPQTNVALAMFYLKCICNVLDLNKGNSNIQKLTDFKNYHLLSEADIDALTLLVVSVKPADLLGKCLFHNENICGNSNNKFFELKDVSQNMTIVPNVLIAGQRRQLNRIMFYKKTWLELCCLLPLEFLCKRMKRRNAENEARIAQSAITYEPPYSTPAYRQQGHAKANPSNHSSSSCCIIT